MSDPYQIGNDVEWVKHTNDELTRLVRRKNGQVTRLRYLCLLLVLLLGWVIYKFTQVAALEELWRLPQV